MHVSFCMTPNIINQLRRLNLTYAEGFVNFCEEMTEKGGFEESVTDRKHNGQTEGQLPNLYKDKTSKNQLKRVHHGLKYQLDIQSFIWCFRKHWKKICI